MDEEHRPSRARDELTAQAIWLAAMVVAIPVLAWVERKSHDPDAFRLAKMRAAKATERFAATTAGEWWKVAERARLLYESERAQ